MPTLREILIAIVVNLVSSGMFLLFQIFLGPSGLEQQVPIWVLALSVGLMLTVMYFIILRMKVDPFLRLIDDMRNCIDDFEKFFHHPHWAIMPNPFSEEPEFWKYYENSFSNVLYSWYLSVKKRYDEARVDMDSNTLIGYSNEFRRIVCYYLMFAKSFRTLTKKHPIPNHIRKQYNMSFVNEFNTIFRPNLLNCIKNIQRTIGKEIPNSDIEPAAVLE